NSGSPRQPRVRQSAVLPEPGEDMESVRMDVNEFHFEDGAHAGDRATNDRWLLVARQAVAELFGEPGERAFTIRYWNGELENPGASAQPQFELILRQPGALRQMFFPPSELALGEAFIRGDFDVAGDLERAVALATALQERLRSPRRLARLTGLLLRLPTDAGRSPDRTRFRPSLPFVRRRHTRARAAAAIRFHYDVGNDFYSLWLDEQRVYSCAYFCADDDDLDRAQTAKLEHICRKLRLQPGEHFVDIGCGWGGLVRHAARHHGVEALGITLSRCQAEYARERIAREGLADRCRIEVCDYRDLPRGTTFDKVASVGMFEHVGGKQLRSYFSAAFALTRPGGLFLNHGIASLEHARPHTVAELLTAFMWRKGKLIDRHVFPDSELVPLADAIHQAEAAGFETRDVESLREHYARTLRHWVRRLEARAHDAAVATNEMTVRLWRLYMAASAYMFSVGRFGVAQVLLARPDLTGATPLPSTRHDLYLHPLETATRSSLCNRAS
ncbi:MAG: class I SAM-dependent methyltransferase, partial [Gemmatimonadota bacterium]